MPGQSSVSVYSSAFEFMKALAICEPVDAVQIWRHRPLTFGLYNAYAGARQGWYHSPSAVGGISACCENVPTNTTSRLGTEVGLDLL